MKSPQISEYILTDETQTKDFAERLAKMQITGSVWLAGDLGAGKTTLTRYWLHAMGYVGSVKSPTYTLVEPYKIIANNGEIKWVYHADLYRLNDPEELDFIGFFEYFTQNSLVIIEWASKAETLLPKPDVVIKINRCDDDKRIATMIDYRDVQ